jgi:FkbM family methyltransferase
MKFFRSQRTQNDLYNHKFILDIYRGLLGRDPDETGMRHYGAMLESGKLDPAGFISSILSSGEFASRMVGGESNGCLRSEAEDVFRRFEKYHGPGSPGYVTNFLGGLTDVRCAAGIDSLSGAVEGYPIPGNFHGETLEWVGTLRSVLDAGSTFTMLELGAGWAPWCVIGYIAAKQRCIRKIRLIAVEGDAGHLDFIQKTFAANKIDPDIGEAIHGVVGVRDGDALFPKANDPSRVYGGVAAFTDAETAAPAFTNFMTSQSALVSRVDRVPCLALTTLMRSCDQVDLIHCDIQGTEAELFANLIEPVSAKVKRIIIGTHSFEIERRLASLFPKHGWQLEGINGCVIREEKGKPVLIRDGVQVWRNARYWPIKEN